MANLNVSAAHSLQLVPINRLSKFAQIKAGVMLVFLEQPDEAEAIPGSIRITTNTEDGKIKKSITTNVEPSTERPQIYWRVTKLPAW